MDPGIICFHHCANKIFCFNLPEYCPYCRVDLQKTDSLLPFRVPYPFVRCSQNPCSVLIKPTVGNFLDDYLNSMDLHIGVTNSAGIIIEYDRNGLQRNQKNWEQCLVVAQMPTSWYDYWDNKLEEFCGQGCWTSQAYDENSQNCFSFVLSFLNGLNYGELSELAGSKTSFCGKYIVPKTTSAGKYISLYRKLKKNGYHVQKPD